MVENYTALFQLSRVTMGTHQIPSSKKFLLAKKVCCSKWQYEKKFSSDLLSFGFSSTINPIIMKKFSTQTKYRLVQFQNTETSQ